jgi:molybdate transport system substrate-binding protein
MAVVVKKGAPKPDISTPDVNAKTIAYSDPAAGGASGVYFAKLLERMGIADQMKGKTRHPPPSGNSANLVVAGEADLDCADPFPAFAGSASRVQGEGPQTGGRAERNLAGN